MRRLLSLLALALPLQAQAAGLKISAASSLTESLTDISRLWQARGHEQPELNFGASSTVAQQIEHGDTIDIFVSADELWMDRLQADHRILPDTRVDIVGNDLVIVQRRAHLTKLEMKPGVAIGVLLGATGRLAIGDPAYVPAGIYAKQALTKLEAWDAVKDRLAFADSVRGALQLVVEGEAPAAVVYATDVKFSKGLAVSGAFPPDSHDPIRYPAAVTSRATLPEARAFVTFLAGPDARDVFTHYGFPPP
jgi:molybdate transport system substrate-binding protein